MIIVNCYFLWFFMMKFVLLIHVKLWVCLIWLNWYVCVLKLIVVAGVKRNILKNNDGGKRWMRFWDLGFYIWWFSLFFKDKDFIFLGLRFESPKKKFVMYVCASMLMVCNLEKRRNTWSNLFMIFFYGFSLFVSFLNFLDYFFDKKLKYVYIL